MKQTQTSSFKICMLNNFVLFFKPPQKWILPGIILSGALCGAGGFNLYVSNALSYLSDRPEACINCHIMFPQYATWSHSSHRESAHCNDCHIPHHNIFSKYYFKAKDGLRHSAIFTLRKEPQVIRITNTGANAVQENCRRCHRELLQNIKTFSAAAGDHNSGEGRLCRDCHREVPHGRVKSLSSTPNAIVPLPYD